MLQIRNLGLGRSDVQGFAQLARGHRQGEGPETGEHRWQSPKTSGCMIFLATPPVVSGSFLVFHGEYLHDFWLGDPNAPGSDVGTTGIHILPQGSNSMIFGPSKWWLFSIQGPLRNPDSSLNWGLHYGRLRGGSLKGGLFAPLSGWDCPLIYPVLSNWPSFFWIWFWEFLGKWLPVSSDYLLRKESPPPTPPFSGVLFRNPSRFASFSGKG